jgi:hypothetical protein
LEKPGFVFQVTSQAGNTDCFAAVYAALKQQYLADALWFGWHETEISLPRRLTNVNEQDALAAHWDVARIFTNSAELRVQRRGDTRLTLLLTENATLESQLQNDFAVLKTAFKNVVDGYRLLAGEKPKKSIGRNTTALIEVRYPRELDYDVGQVANYGEMLVANVKCYYDDVQRLKFVRYCHIRPQTIGTIGVKPYA